MNEPYKYADAAGRGTTLVVGESDHMHVAALMAVSGNGGRKIPVYVAGDDFPALIRALYESAGLPEPLILNRPEHTGGTEYAGKSDRYAYTSRVGLKVAIGWRGIEPGEFDPDEALEFAAHIAVNAEAVKRNEPEQADVDRLAMLIELQGFGLDYERCVKLARSILLDKYKREAR